MRYFIFLFSISIFLGSCIHNDKQTSTINNAQNDSIVFKEPYIKERLETDSIEVIKKIKVKDTVHSVQKIIFIDNKYCNIDKRYVQKQADSINKHFNFADYQKYFNDTNSRASNPFPELNSTYLEVKKYHGKYVLPSDFILFSMISDSFFMGTSLMEHAFCRIHHSSKEGYVYKIKTGWSIENFMIEIVVVDNNSGLQIWKTIHSDLRVEYHLQMPLRTALKLPIIYSMNDLGEGEDLEIDFDKVEFESLLKSK
jgi:hypothetical protein